MILLVEIVVGVILLFAIRSGRDRFDGMFTRPENIHSPGDDGIGRAMGVQEEDTVGPWRPSRQRATRDEAGDPD